LAALAIVSLAAGAHGQGVTNDPSDERHIAELGRGLDALRAELQGKPRHPLVFSVNLFFAHGGVVTRFPLETMLKCVDAFHEAGARRVDINPAIDPWRNNDTESIKKYDAVIAHIRRLGMQLAINPEVNHRHDKSETFATWKAAALKAYGEMARRYKPDVFAVIHEPTTMTARILPGLVSHETRGYVQSMTQAVDPPAWANFVKDAVDAVKSASPKTRCAAGVLYFERPFFKAFVGLKNLDAISLDIYSLNGIRVYDAMIEAALRQGKTVYIEESWRETHTDPMWAKFTNITPRPGGSAAFQKIDSKWLETLSQYASARGLEAITACGVTSMQCLFYYAADSHGGNLDPMYVQRVIEAIKRGERTKTFATLKHLTAQYAP
jgi:hypothetical protein